MKSWLRSPSGIISIALFIIIVVLYIINALFYDVMITDYSSGIVTEFIGIIVTVIFVQVLFDRKNINDEKETEKKAIMRFDKVMQQYIDRYRIFYYCVHTPLEERNFENIDLTDDFCLKDMRDLHQISLLMSEKTSGSAIDSFLKTELALRNYIHIYLGSVEFKYFPLISEVLLQFTETSIKFDHTEAILEAKWLSMGEKTSAEFVSDLLKDMADDFYKDMCNGIRRESNMIQSYIVLYEMMRIECSALISYKVEIDRLKLN